MLDTAKVVVLVSIVMITVFEAVAQSCLKKSQKNGMSFLFYVGILSYIVVCVLLMNCYKNEAYLGKVNLIWSCFSIILIITIGYFIFEEKIYIHDIIAIILAIGAIITANQ
jgi:multidrug transporter EmrE-like cation transporter